MNALIRPGTPGTLMGTAASGGAAPEAKDYFVARRRAYAGTHLIIDLWAPPPGDRIISIACCARRRWPPARPSCTATSTISPDGGVTGVLVLAESHVSIHTWPERDYAALDIFVCGECDPYGAAGAEAGFPPDRVQLAEQSAA